MVYAPGEREDCSGQRMIIGFINNEPAWVYLPSRMANIPEARAANPLRRNKHPPPHTLPPIIPPIIVEATTTHVERLLGWRNLPYSFNVVHPFNLLRRVRGSWTDRIRLPFLAVLIYYFYIAKYEYEGMHWPHWEESFKIALRDMRDTEAFQAYLSQLTPAETEQLARGDLSDEMVSSAKEKLFGQHGVRIRMASVETDVEGLWSELGLGSPIAPMSVAGQPFDHGRSPSPGADTDGSKVKETREHPSELASAPSSPLFEPPSPPSRGTSPLTLKGMRRKGLLTLDPGNPPNFASDTDNDSETETAEENTTESNTVEETQPEPGNDKAMTDVEQSDSEGRMTASSFGSPPSHVQTHHSGRPDDDLTALQNALAGLQGDVAGLQGGFGILQQNQAAFQQTLNEIVRQNDLLVPAVQGLASVMQPLVQGYVLQQQLLHPTLQQQQQQIANVQQQQQLRQQAPQPPSRRGLVHHAQIVRTRRRVVASAPYLPRRRATPRRTVVPANPSPLRFETTDNDADDEDNPDSA
jgi:uncharacterized protein YoxC